MTPTSDLHRLWHRFSRWRRRTILDEVALSVLLVWAFLWLLSIAVGGCT